VTDHSITRRGFLAAAGTTVVAGCGGFDGNGTRSSETISSARLPEDIDRSKPLVVRQLPIGIEQAYLRESEDRVLALLTSLPMPLTQAAIPNGYVRQEVINAASDATNALNAARDTQNRFQALLKLHDARVRARYAAAGWGAIDGEVTETELRSEHQETIGAAQSLKQRHAYLGADPIAALLVHARIEHTLSAVLDGDGPSTYGIDDSILAVAEWGAHAEHAESFVAESEYVYDRFQAAIPDDSGTIEDQLTTARETLSDELQQRRDRLDPEADDYAQGQIGQLLHRIRSDAVRSVDDVAGRDRPASAVLRGTTGLTEFDAYDRLKSRIADGERLQVTEASEIHDARQAARTAIRTALAESPQPAVARHILGELAATLVWTDERLARYQGDINPAQLSDPVREYLSVTLRAKGVPAACQQLQEALQL
jgi:hypothetical protein